jgi:metal-dependent amidase/aminoacylase/carboxypeptidase family protein
MCRIMDRFTAMAPGLDPRDADTFATVVGARLGRDDAFGTAPGRAEIRTTLRSATNEAMRRLVAQAEAIVTTIAAPAQLATDIGYRDIFPATVNNPEAVMIIQRAAGREPVTITDRPFRWSEDFGRLTTRFRGALFGIGAGRKISALHSPDYDFPDALIEPAVTVLGNILRSCLA